MNGSTTLAPPGVAACPRCEFPLASTAAECARCGVVLARFEPSREAPRATVAASPVLAAVPENALDAEARRALIGGAAIAAVALALPLARFVFSYVMTLVHELGHAAAGWLFGYPSIPAFDFAHGGGVTAHEARRPALLFLIAVALGWALWSLRGRRRALAAGGVAVGLYAILALTRYHDAMMIAMGHGSELVFAGIFFYRALSGYAVRVPAERPLYAFLAFFIVARDMHFAAGLVTSENARRLYAEAKGGGHWMDFSQLAHDFGVRLETVAASFLLCSFAALPLTWILFRCRHRVAALLSRLAEPTAD